MAKRGRFRFLMVICIPAAIAGLFEYLDPDGLGSKTDPETSIPVWEQLYPNDEESLRTRARDEIRIGRFAEARQLLETAITADTTTNEDLLYDYILLLKAMKAETADVDAAVANWQRNFPHSERPNPIANSQSSN